MQTFWRRALVAVALVGVYPAGSAFAADAPLSRSDYFRPGLAPVRTRGAYDVTIVYFMDYQCPACRRFTPDVTRALGEDRRVRVIYRDTPIFGPRSVAAARSAIAAAYQGRHEAMHGALMAASLPLDDVAIRAAATVAGVDWPRLQRDLVAHGPAIDRLLAYNQRLSLGTGISGTPAFIIGDTLSNGALTYAQLKESIAAARTRARRR